MSIHTPEEDGSLTMIDIVDIAEQIPHNALVPALLLAAQAALPCPPALSLEEQWQVDALRRNFIHDRLIAIITCLIAEEVDIEDVRSCLDRYIAQHAHKSVH